MINILGLYFTLPWGKKQIDNFKKTPIEKIMCSPGAAQPQLTRMQPTPSLNATLACSQYYFSILKKNFYRNFVANLKTRLKNVCFLKMFLKSRVKKFYTNNDITIVGAA
jgi:hypothetical protein